MIIILCRRKIKIRSKKMKNIKNYRIYIKVHYDQNNKLPPSWILCWFPVNNSGSWDGWDVHFLACVIYPFMIWSLLFLHYQCMFYISAIWNNLAFTRMPCAISYSSACVLFLLLCMLNSYLKNLCVRSSHTNIKVFYTISIK